MAFNGRFILNISHLASKQGANLPQLIQLSGKTLEELKQEDCIVDDANYNRVVEAVINATGDALFGLHAGENLNLTAAGLILQLVQTSETVKQAFELCCQFANLGCSALPMKLVELSDCYELQFNPNKVWRNDSEIAFQHTALGTIAFKVREFQSLTLMEQSALKIHFPWAHQESKKELEQSLQCPIFFNQTELSIFFSKESIDAQIYTSNYNLLQTLVHHAEQISEKKKGQFGFKSSVTQSIINLIKPEFPSINQVASHLNISKRTLQRRLNEEGLSFKKIIEELKKEFALGYMKKADLSISDITYLLNYTEVGTFTRSFKRWTGKTPTQYRKSILLHEF